MLFIETFSIQQNAYTNNKRPDQATNLYTNSFRRRLSKYGIHRFFAYQV